MSISEKIEQDSFREIIEDFARAIESKRATGPKPESAVIYFRNEHRDGETRLIEYVPIELLRFRKDNGRISSNTESYEHNFGRLKEDTLETQEVLKEFLLAKDPEKTNELKKSIQHTRQEYPAIITADGFLVNGNRRKLVLEQLFEETKDDRYKFMKVVILPGKGDPGGPPTKTEIEKIENRYQSQSDGKAEYYGFDKAISMRKKIESGLSLEEQLKDDPQNVNINPREFKKIIKKYEDEYLKPLEAVDQYLLMLNRSGMYTSVSTGRTDGEGRWQAFLDYFSQVGKKLEDEKKRYSLGIKEEEIGDIEEVAFKIIRKRDFSNTGLGKVHMVMRKFPKLLKNEKAKKELFELLDIDIELDKDEQIDSSGNEYGEREKDKIWARKYGTNIV